MKMSQEANKRASGRNPEQIMVVNSNSYVLNKVKALKKKQTQCEAAHLSYQMKPDRNFVMRMSPAAYELTKLIVVEELYSDPFYNNFYIESGINEDECQNQVGSIFRIFNRKKDSSKGISLKFTINFYHTTSTILVNGNKVEIFEKELFERICQGIRKYGAKLTIVNEQISMALSDIERKHSSKNMGTRSKHKLMIEYNGTDTGVSSETEKAAVCSDKTIGLEEMRSDTSAFSLGDLRGDIYQCPICDLTADGETIACEECGEWFHFACAGLDKAAASSIHDDVPYICLLCNDNQLYSDSNSNQEMSKEKQTLDPLVPNNEHSHTSVPNNEHSHIQVSQSDPQTYNLGRLDIDRAESSNLKEKTVRLNNDNHISAVGGSDILADLNKKNKGEKAPNNLKKTGNSDNQETLIAQKYYITSLEGKINHLENLIKVMERTVDNTLTHKAEPVTVSNQASQHDRSSCACVEQINYKLLENRLQLLESQHQMWNNLHLQNQLQLQYITRERYAPLFQPPFQHMVPTPHPVNSPMAYSAPPGCVPLIPAQPLQTPYGRCHLPTNIPGHFVPQNAFQPYVYGHPIAQAAMPVIPQTHVQATPNGPGGIGTTSFQRRHPPSSGPTYQGNPGDGKVDNHMVRPLSGTAHKQNNPRRKRPHPNNTSLAPKQSGRTFQYSDHSAEGAVEHGCSTAAFRLHEVPPSSTPGAAETPRGAPDIAHPIPEEISDTTDHSRNISPEDTVIIPPEHVENLALEHGNIPAVNNDQITVQSLQKSSLNNQSQPHFLRIPGMKKAPPDLENLEADLTWETTSTRL